MRSGHSWHTEIRSRPESCAVDITKTSQFIAAGQNVTDSSNEPPLHALFILVPITTTEHAQKHELNESSMKNLTSLSSVTQNQSSIRVKRRIETTKPGNSRNRWKNRCHNSTKGGISKKLSFSGLPEPQSTKLRSKCAGRAAGDEWSDWSGIRCSHAQGEHRMVRRWTTMRSVKWVLRWSSDKELTRSQQRANRAVAVYRPTQPQGPRHNVGPRHRWRVQPMMTSCKSYKTPDTVVVFVFLIYLFYIIGCFPEIAENWPWDAKERELRAIEAKNVD